MAGSVARVTDPGDAVAFRAKVVMADEAMRPQAIADYCFFRYSKSGSIDAGERKQGAFLNRTAILVKRIPDHRLPARPAGPPICRAAALSCGSRSTTSSPADRRRRCPWEGVMRIWPNPPHRSRPVFLRRGPYRPHAGEGGEVVAPLGRVVDVGYKASRLEYRDHLSRSTSEQRFRITLFNDGKRPAES